jgi:uncharacterized protein
MALDEFLLSLLEDPVDHGPLLYVASASVLYNPRRRVAYEVRDSIPVMLPDEARQVADEEHQRLVESPEAIATGPRE